MILFPACRLTSAAGSQEQPEGQWVDLQDPLEICPFTHQPTLPPREGRARGCHPTPAGPAQQDTPKTQDSSGCSILVWAFGSYVSGRISLLECCKLRSGLFVPVAALRVTIWHRARLSSAAACQNHAVWVSATRRGGITFSLRVFWKWELASFPCRKVLTILHQPRLLFLVLSVLSCVFGSAVRNL